MEKRRTTKGWYYVKDIHNEERLDRYFKETDNFEYLEDWEVDEVLGRAPSYEEYQQLLSDQLAKNEGVEINAELEERLKKTQKLELDLRKENTKLKKLLKESRFLLGKTPYENMSQCLTFNDVMNRIDQVLGEE